MQKSRLKELLSNKTVANAKWMIGEQMVQMMISVIIGVITARYLGPSNYGVINYVAAYVAFFTSFCTLGLEGVIIKEMVGNRDEEGTILGTGLFMRLISSFCSIVAIMLILYIADDGDTLILKVGFLQSLVLLFRAFELIDFWFQSYLKSKSVAIVKSISYFLVAIYKTFILVTGKSVQWFAFSTSLDFLLIAIMLVWIYKKHDGPKLKVSKEIALNLIKQSAPFILSGVIITIYQQMDKIMLRQMLSEVHVGWYSAATTVCNYWVLIPTAIINAVRPSIMERKHAKDEEAYLKRLKQLYALLLWVGFFVSLVVSLLSHFIINLLYGNEYEPAAGALALAIWYTTFSTIGIARGIWLVCENKNKYILGCVFWGAVINGVLNYILIPVIGINGAAVATLVTQIFNSLIAPLMYKEIRVHTKYVIEGFLLKGIK